MIKFVKCFVACQWFSPFSSTNKTDPHEITEILLNMVLNTINKLPTQPINWFNPATCVCLSKTRTLISNVKVFFMFNKLKWGLIVCFMDIGGIVESLFKLSFLLCKINKTRQTCSLINCIGKVMVTIKIIG